MPHKKKIAVCQGCGAKADRQSDIVLNSRDDLFSCPVCKGVWQEVSENSLPIQLEEA